MPLDFLPDFALIVFLTLVLSAFALLLTVRSPSEDLSEFGPLEDDDSPFPQVEERDDVTEKIIPDEEPLESPPPVQVPHIDIPGAKLGGGARDEDCSKATGTISLQLNEDPDERRTHNRRMRERRVATTPVGKEQRLVERRVWLRRREDHQKMKLLTVTEAAETLETSVEQIYKWLGNADIPFYQISEGKRKVIRFEINELLQWFSAFVTKNNPSKLSEE